MREASPSRGAGRSDPDELAASLLHPAVDEHHVLDGCGTAVVDDGRASVRTARGDLVERDHHDVRPPADLDRSDLVLAASQSGAIWFYDETT